LFSRGAKGANFSEEEENVQARKAKESLARTVREDKGPLSAKKVTRSLGTRTAKRKEKKGRGRTKKEGGDWLELDASWGDGQATEKGGRKMQKKIGESANSTPAGARSTVSGPSSKNCLIFAGKASGEELRK